jgi:hypothetical protein
MADDRELMIRYHTALKQIAERPDGAGYIARSALGYENPGQIPIKRQADSTLHRQMAHPEFDYHVTEGPRKAWDEADTPPEGIGWERNVFIGANGWERHDFTEESYWMRRRPIKGAPAGELPQYLEPASAEDHERHAVHFQAPLHTFMRFVYLDEKDRPRPLHKAYHRDLADRAMELLRDMGAARWAAYNAGTGTQILRSYDPSNFAESGGEAASARNSK